MDSELDRLSTDVLTALAQNEFAPRTTREAAIDILLDRHLGRPEEPPALATRRREQLEELRLELQTGRKVTHYTDPHAEVQPALAPAPVKRVYVTPSSAFDGIPAEECQRARNILPEILRRFGVGSLHQVPIPQWTSYLQGTMGFGRTSYVVQALLLVHSGHDIGGSRESE